MYSSRPDASGGQYPDDVIGNLDLSFADRQLIDQFLDRPEARVLWIGAEYACIIDQRNIASSSRTVDVLQFRNDRGVGTPRAVIPPE